MRLKISVKLIRNNNIFYCAASLKVVIKLTDENIIIFIDIGSKINIIDKKNLIIEA